QSGSLPRHSLAQSASLRCARCVESAYSGAKILPDGLYPPALPGSGQTPQFALKRLNQAENGGEWPMRRHSRHDNPDNWPFLVSDRVSSRKILLPKPHSPAPRPAKHKPAKKVLDKLSPPFQKYGDVFRFHSCSYSCSCSAFRRLIE